MRSQLAESLHTHILQLHLNTDGPQLGSKLSLELLYSCQADLPSQSCSKSTGALLKNADFLTYLLVTPFQNSVELHQSISKDRFSTFDKCL